MSKIDLLRHTNEITTLECSTCNRVDTVKDAAEQAIDELFKKGWRVKKNECKCPTCNGVIQIGFKKEPSVTAEVSGYKEVGC